MYGTVSIAEYRYLRQHSTTISHFAARTLATSNVEGPDGQTVRVSSAFVSADYFEALGIRMAAGRGFLAADEDYAEPSAVAIISDRLWRNRFGGDPSVIDRSIRINTLVFRVIGVAQRGFVDVDRGATGTDVWMPLPASALRASGPTNLARFSDPRGDTFRSLAVRLRAGTSRQAAAADLSVLSQQFRQAASLPSNGFEVTDTRPISRFPAGSMGTVLPAYTPLALAAVLVLLVACANVGNLLLASTSSRQREIAIRLSLGASRARIVTQLVMEAAVLSATAAAVGLGLAFVVPRVMVGLGFLFGPLGFTRITGTVVPSDWNLSFFAPDAAVWAFAALLACGTTVLGVLAPALRIKDAGAVGLLSLAGAPCGRRVSRGGVRFLLLSAQIAVTMVLLVGAAALTRGMTQATSINRGFAPDGIQVVSVQLDPALKREPKRDSAFLLGLTDALGATDLGPVVVSDFAPFEDANLMMMVRRPDQSPGESQLILRRPVSKNYFALLKIPMVRGRAPASDTDSRELVVSEAAARALWPSAEPIGQTLISAVTQTEFQTYEVVGVAKDVPVRSMSDIEPVIYHAPSWIWSPTHLLVRSSSPAVAERVRAVAAGLEPRVTISVRPFSDYVGGSMATAALASRTAWAIGALGLVLAIAGAFGVFAHEVAERRYEIGIRMAVGASGREIARLMMRRASQALLWGAAGGFVMSVLAVPVLRRYLYGLSPFDPIAYVQVIGILAVATAVATWVPTRRAISVDPVRTLRGD